MSNTTHVTAGTPMPFTIVRNLVTFDAADNEVRLPAVRITIERACWDPAAVEEVGFEGDWYMTLTEDPRFAHLTDDEVEAAEDCACHVIEDLAYRLAKGESVPVDADGERDWYPKASWNI